eukprot:TRINITY_DN3303_c0_g1_i4.p1 TRINITY_DN3303_c0_g1~~TRINITY_DN3303_c0_g1_i4.p1  ORF type:complete len:261 (-),score=32.54 TRINITY_DN3303_c0_g1_i4:1112-1894(-)
MQSVTLVCISLLVLVYVYETNAIGANNRFRTVPRSFQSLSLDRRSATTNASIVWVEDFGAKGDGNTDDTASFQAALTAMGNLKGGIVMVGRGNYAIRGNLDIPMAVTLQGIYQAVPSHDVRDQEPLYEDSILLAFAGKGSDQGTAFITMHENSVLRGVAIFYPEQVNKGVPVAYPWTISMSGNNPAVYDVELLNPYQGISAVAAHRHYIARVQGQPLRVGIFIDQTYDIGRIENVHWNPWFSMDPVLLDWQVCFSAPKNV